MKESIFKKDKDKIHAGTNFTKNPPVSSFLTIGSEEKLLSQAIGKLDELFSKLRAAGFSKEELEIVPSPSCERLTVRVKSRRGRCLSFGELNLICRIATDLGLTPRISDKEVEIFSPIAMLESANLYSKTVLLLREHIESSFPDTVERQKI